MFIRLHFLNTLSFETKEKHSQINQNLPYLPFKLKIIFIQYKTYYPIISRNLSVVQFPLCRLLFPNFIRNR